MIHLTTGEEYVNVLGCEFTTIPGLGGHPVPIFSMKNMVPMPTEGQAGKDFKQARISWARLLRPKHEQPRYPDDPMKQEQLLFQQPYNRHGEIPIPVVQEPERYGIRAVRSVNRPAALVVVGPTPPDNSTHSGREQEEMGEPIWYLNQHLKTSLAVDRTHDPKNVVMDAYIDCVVDTAGVTHYPPSGRREFWRVRVIPVILLEFQPTPRTDLGEFLWRRADKDNEEMNNAWDTVDEDRTVDQHVYNTLKQRLLGDHRSYDELLYQAALVCRRLPDDVKLEERLVRGSVKRKIITRDVDLTVLAWVKPQGTDNAQLLREDLKDGRMIDHPLYRGSQLLCGSEHYSPNMGFEQCGGGSCDMFY